MTRCFAADDAIRLFFPRRFSLWPVIAVPVVLAVGLAVRVRPRTPPHWRTHGIVFPKVLGPMQGRLVQMYDKPELGILSPPPPRFFKADVYVYNGGNEKLGTGIKAELDRAALPGGCRTCWPSRSSGEYKDVTRSWKGRRRCRRPRRFPRRSPAKNSEMLGQQPSD